MHDTTVEVGRTRGFILDDPVAGVLDNTEFPLGGVFFYDVSRFVSSVSVQRGKNRELDRFSAGTLGVVLNNESRFFDPFGATEIDPIPRVPIRVTSGSVVQFTGVVEDWDYSYEPGGRSSALVNAADDLTRLARTSVVASGTATPELSGARVNRVLDMDSVRWPEDHRFVDVGDSFLCSDVFEGQNALEYLQLVEVSEQGQLFVGKGGDLVFRSRTSATPRTGDVLVFADDGSGVPYNQVQVNYGTELMVNRVTVSAPLSTAVAENVSSQTTFGVISEELTVLCASASVVQNIADFVVARFGEPEYRFETLLIDVDGLAAGQVADVLALEIGDVVEVKFTPNGVGAPIDRFAQVIGVSHEVGPMSHQVSLRLSSLEFAFFVLDDVVFGILDTNHLGF